MAQLGVAVVGGILGSFVGMPQLGFMAGGMIGGMLFGSGSSGGGPRMKDLKVTSSAYGVDIPVLYGTARMTGNMIWATDIVEKKASSGKGGIGSSSAQQTYNYYGNFAIAFCEGEVDQLLKVWADSTLIFDSTGDSDKVSKNGKKVKPAVKNTKYIYRFYKGTEDQMPDSLIKTKTEKLHGAGSCPAYRGLCYIVYDNVPLKKFGNRIPNISVLLSTLTTTVNSATAASASGSVASPTNITKTAADWNRRVIYGITGGITSTDNALVAIDPADMHTISNSLYPAVLDAAETTGTYFTAIGAGKSGNIYAALHTSSNYNRLIKINPDTFKQVLPGFGVIDPNTAGTLTDNRNFVFNARNVDKLFEVKVAGGSGGVGYVLCSVNTGGIPMLINAATMTYLWGGYKQIDGTTVMTDYPSMTYAFGSCKNFSVPGREANGSADVGVLNGAPTMTGNTLELYTISISTGAAYTAPATSTNGILFKKQATIKTIDFDPSYISLHPANDKLEAMSFSYDPSDDSYIIQVKYQTSSVPAFKMLKWSAQSGLLWATKIDYGFAMNGPYQNTQDGNMSWTDGGAKPYNLIDLPAGAILYNNSGPATPSGLQTGMGSIPEQFYDSVTGSLILVKSGIMYSVPFGILQGLGGDLVEIVTDICRRSGLEDSLFDTSSLPPHDVLGYVITRNSTGKELLLQLSGTYFFDAGESDYKLKFKPKGQASVVTLEQEYMGSVGKPEDGDYWIPRRMQEQDLPVIIELKYFDINSDYQEGMQVNKRAVFPWKASWSNNKMSIDAPLALGADEARQIGEKTLFTAYIERESGQAKLPWRYIALDPTDVVTFSLEGLTQDFRLVKVAMGADMNLAIDAVAQNIVSYSSIVEGETSGTEVTTTVAQPASSAELFILNVPLLRDVDDSGGSVGRRYYGAGQYTAGWPGGVLNISNDNVSYSEFDSSVTLTPDWGTATNILGNTNQPFSLDDANTLTVIFKSWVTPPSTVTYLDMLSGLNMALLGTEVIQFQTVTDNTDGSYTLSNLLRGRRGTEWACGTHVSSERLIMLNPAALDTRTVALSERNALRYYRLVTDGDFIDTTPTITDTYLGRDLMPYAPVNFKRTIAGADLSITWSRRARLAGDLLDGTGAIPLNETTESYEIYLLAAPYNVATFDPTNAGTYVRKFTVSTTTALYTAAQMTTDTFTIGSSILYGVGFQISGVVGRGFPGPFKVAP